jgi:hypothetical protein
MAAEDNWLEDQSGLSNRQKKILFKEVRKFNEYGNSIHQDVNLRELAKKLSILSEYVDKYLNEKVSGFDGITVNRNVRELKKYVNKFGKEASKVQERLDRVTALYEDIGMILNRYFEIDEDPNTLNEEKADLSRVKKALQKDEFLQHAMRRMGSLNNPSEEDLRTLYNRYIKGDDELERLYNRL